MHNDELFRRISGTWQLEMMDRKTHWDQIYSAQSNADLSWYQETPVCSLAMIKDTKIGYDCPIIDVGGGTSSLVERLLDEGYQDLTVLDISGTATKQSRQRLGARASLIEWIEQDVTHFSAQRSYGLWHDRAVFHFLIRAEDRKRYRQALYKALRVGGQALISTFAPDGPEKCSGLEIMRHDAASLGRELGGSFQLLEQRQELHRTPAGKSQRFGYFRFIREEDCP